jgi:hypothetical protein
MMAKLMMTASVKEVAAVMFRSVMLALPADRLLTQQL